MEKIVKLIKTCDACPSQWEGKTDKGEKVYIRYRWGCLRVSKSDGKSDDVYDAIPGIEIHYSEPGHELDGSIGTKEMKEKVKAEVIFTDE